MNVLPEEQSKALLEKTILDLKATENTVEKLKEENKRLRQIIDERDTEILKLKARIFDIIYLQ